MTKQKLMDTNYNKQNFQELIEKYLDGKISLEEVKLLVNYYNSFQQENKWVEELGPEENIKNKMLINILEAIEEETPKETKIISLFKTNIFRFGVAAAVLLFVFFNAFEKLSPTSNDIVVPEVIVVDNNIKIGTDKATLTREDGTTVILEKGKSFSTQNVVSNGEQLTYTNDENSVAAVAYNYLTIPRGGQFFLKLSDGTKVWLNSESKVKYPVTFPKHKTREIELVYGEAYFEVSPSTLHDGAKFKVNNASQSIEVVGTEFNVKAYKDDNGITTSLVEGKVNVKNNFNEKYLKPGEASYLNLESGKITTEKVDIQNAIAWKNGYFMFSNESLENMTTNLSRWYNVVFVFENEKKKHIRFTGVLNRYDDINKLLKKIEKTDEVSFKIEKNQITIK